MNAFSIIRFGALIAAVAIPGSAGVAVAQDSPYMDFNDPSVTVDLSVIDDGGYGPGGPGPAGNRTRQLKLLIPGARAPTSMLHVPPAGGGSAALSRPAPAPRSVARRPAPKPKKTKKTIVRVEPTAPAPVVAPAAPKKPIIAAAPPKKLEAPAPAPSAPPKKKPEATTQTQSAPPPPTIAAAPKVTPSEPPAPVVSAAKKQQTEQASLPAANAAGGDTEPGLAMQVVFSNDATRLPTDAKNKLKSLASRLKSKDNLRLQLMAYAGGDKLSASLARRLSLSRALSVRSFLIENGIRSTRIDVRALGNKTDQKPLNRVDLNITER